MWWHTRRNQIRSSSETDESIYIGGGVSSVEYWLSWSEGRGRTIVVTLDGLFRVKLKTADYPRHSPLSPSLLLPCVTVCRQLPFPLNHMHLEPSIFYFVITEMNIEVQRWNSKENYEVRTDWILIREAGLNEEKPSLPRNWLFAD